MTENRTDFLKLLNRQREALAWLEETVYKVAEQLEEMDVRQGRLIEKLGSIAKDLHSLRKESSFFADDFKEAYREWEMGYYNRGSIFYVGINGSSSVWNII
jgi:hypothetical protein